MRDKRTACQSIFLFRPEHEVGKVLRQISLWLDDNPTVFGWIAADLGASKNADRGRPGMPCDQVLRAGLILAYRQISFRELAFCLRDSMSFQHFVRVDPFLVPSKSTLQRNISAIKPATWERIHRRHLQFLIEEGFESAHSLRIDSTVTSTHILKPTDSKLLYDGVMRACRLMKKVKKQSPIRYVNHSRRARRAYLAAYNAKSQAQRLQYYETLIKDLGETRDALQETRLALQNSGLRAWIEQADELVPLLNKVLYQTIQRVFEGETVPVESKLVSLQEPHTDIIKKGGRETFFGHKLNLVTGRSGTVLDVYVEDGNPADSVRFLPMLKRHIDQLGIVPKEVAADGGYASEANLSRTKALGVANVAFHKRVNLTIENMTGGDAWLYRELRCFRAGIEAGISYLKRCFGLGRIWRHGRTHFDAYVWMAVLTHNLIRWARST